MRCTEAGSGSESARASTHDPRVRTSALALMQPGRFWTVFCFAFFFPSVRSRDTGIPSVFSKDSGSATISENGCSCGGRLRAISIAATRNIRAVSTAAERGA